MEATWRLRQSQLGKRFEIIGLIVFECHFESLCLETDIGGRRDTAEGPWLGQAVTDSGPAPNWSYPVDEPQLPLFHLAL